MGHFHFISLEETPCECQFIPYSSVSSRNLHIFDVIQSSCVRKQVVCHVPIIKFKVCIITYPFPAILMCANSIIVICSGMRMYNLKVSSSVYFITYEGKVSGEGLGKQRDVNITSIFIVGVLFLCWNNLKRKRTIFSGWLEIWKFGKLEI